MNEVASLSATRDERDEDDIHLTTDQLATRWHTTKETISRKYRKLGLRPMRIGRRQLFTVSNVEEVERRNRGEPA